jgi:hypothetical protein
MKRRPGTVVLDNEAVTALSDVHHSKHPAVLAILEVANQRQARNERLRVIVPTAVRFEAGWDRNDPGAAELNRISRAADSPLDTVAANRCVQLRHLVADASVVDASVAQAAEAAALQPVTVVTSDAGDIGRFAAHLTTTIVVAVI